MATKVHSHHKVSSFNPAWCLRPPIKVSTHQNGNKGPSNSPHRAKKLKDRHHRRHSPRPSSVEPTSPRVGCMGQIRQCKAQSSWSSSSSSRSSSASTPNITGQFSLSMPKKGAISSLPSPSAPLSSGLLVLKRVLPAKAVVEEMDPPRPVEMKSRPQNLVGLWERRGGGGEGGLKVQLPLIEEVCA